VPSARGGTPKEEESTRSSGGLDDAASAWEVTDRCSLRHRLQIEDEDARRSGRSKIPEACCAAILTPMREVRKAQAVANGFLRESSILPSKQAKLLAWHHFHGLGSIA
jgi:hypothetical protein